jgi:hypothetical protein
MNNYIIRFAALALLPAALFTFSSCSCTTPPKGNVETMAVATPEGAIVVETTTLTATVKSIDAAKQKITLVFPNGSKTTYKAGPEVVNFGQIQVGDKITAMVTEEVAIFIGSGAPSSSMTETTVALAPAGARPGSVIVDTEQVTVKIIGVDAAKYKVTFELPDGTTKTVKSDKKVDVSKLHPGDNVTVLISEGFAVTVEKPDSHVPNEKQI